MNHDHLTDANLDLYRGALGVVTAAVALVTSHLEVVEAWLRIASLLVGISVGLVTIWSILRRRRR